MTFCCKESAILGYCDCNRGPDAPSEKDHEAIIADLLEALEELIEALDAVDAEGERAAQPGATAWSSGPVVRSIYARKKARAAIAKATE